MGTRNLTHRHGIAARKQPTMKPCITPECGKPKAPGQGQRYCSGCQSAAKDTRRTDQARRIRKWETANPDRARLAKRRYNASPRARAAINSARRNHRAADPHVAWSTSLKERYGITAHEYEQILNKQHGCCALCGKDATRQKRRLHVDHDHRCCPMIGRSCGRCIRGLLCQGCNRLLGWYERRRSEIAQYIDSRQELAE